MTTQGQVHGVEAPPVGDDATSETQTREKAQSRKDVKAGSTESWWARAGHAARLIAIVGPPISFALLHIAYSQFYGKFGLVPEDVGLDITRVLATSVTAILIAFAAFVVLWGLALVPTLLALPGKPKPEDGEAAKQKSDEDAKRSSVGELLFWLSLGAAANFLAAHELAQTNISQKLKVAAWLLLALPTVIVASDRLQWKIAKTVRAKVPETDGSFSAILWAALVLSGITTYDEMHGLTAQYANRALVGRPFSSATLKLPFDFGFTAFRAFDIRADAASVDWIGRPPAGVWPRDCLLYLGSSGGTSFIFDVRTHETIRIAPSSAAITTSRTSTTCGPPA